MTEIPYHEMIAAAATLGAVWGLWVRPEIARREKIREDLIRLDERMKTAESKHADIAALRKEMTEGFREIRGSISDLRVMIVRAHPDTDLGDHNG